MILTAHAFQEQLAKDAKEIGVAIEQVVGVFGLALFQSVKFGSPITGSPGQAVDTTRLRESWIMALRVLKFATDGAADSPINTDHGSLAGFKLGDSIYIATNLVYATRQEYEHATHAGSLRQTVAHAQALLDEIVKRYRHNPPPTQAAA